MFRLLCESRRINCIFMGEEGRFQMKIMHVSLLIRRAKHMLAEKMLWQNRILVWNLAIFLRSFFSCFSCFWYLNMWTKLNSLFQVLVGMFLHILIFRKFESWITWDLLWGAWLILEYLVGLKFIHVLVTNLFLASLEIVLCKNTILFHAAPVTITKQSFS